MKTIGLPVRQSWSTGPLCTDPLRRASADAYQLVSATPKGVATLSSPSWSAVVCYCGSSKYEVRCVHGQDDATHIRQDSMKWITYNKSVSMVIAWVRRGVFMCCWRTCFDVCSQKWIEEHDSSVVGYRRTHGWMQMSYVYRCFALHHHSIRKLGWMNIL